MLNRQVANSSELSRVSAVLSGSCDEQNHLEQHGRHITTTVTCSMKLNNALSRIYCIYIKFVLFLQKQSYRVMKQFQAIAVLA